MEWRGGMRWIAIFCMLFALLWQPAIAEEEITNRIASLEQRTSEINGKISKIQSAVRAAQKRLAEFRSQKSQLQTREQNLQERLDAIAQELLLAEEEISILKEKVEILGQRKWARLRIVDQTEYLDSFLRVLMKGDGSVEQDDLMLLTSELQRRENDTVWLAKQAVIGLARKREQEQELLKEKISTRERIRKEREDLSLVLQKTESEETSLKKQQRDLQSEVVKLQAEALRLETLLAGWETKHVELEGSQKRSRRVFLDFDEKSEKSSVLQKGELTPPVRGDIVKRFKEGGANSPRRNGVIYRAENRSDVVSVAEGVVSFSGDLPFFGRSVIVEHAPGEFSLYGGVETDEALSVGDQVKKGEKLGEKDGGGELYLELRRGGKPINPEPLVD